MARSQIGDVADMMKAFPQITYNEYMYERSYAQLQILAGDSTHVHYFNEKDKKIWENYKKIIKAQNEFESFLSQNGAEQKTK